MKYHFQVWESNLFLQGSYSACYNENQEVSLGVKVQDGNESGSCSEIAQGPDLSCAGPLQEDFDQSRRFGTERRSQVGFHDIRYLRNRWL